MRVVFAGTPEVALPALEAVAASAHDLVGVVTRPDAPAGRGRRMVASPVGLRAEELGVPVLKPAHPREPEFQAALAALEPDCVPVVAYGALIPESALAIPAKGWVNLHFSVLPAWRGAAPVQHAIWAGDEVTGATTFRIVRELDAGPTYGLMTQTIRPTDTAGDLLARLAEGGAGLLVATLDGIADGSLEERDQPSDGVSLAPKITVDDARIDWSEPAMAVDRRVRACTPAPGAWSTYDGERIKLGPVRSDPDHERLAPGTLIITKNSVHVGTATEPGAARNGARPRPQGDAGRRLGPRAPARRRRAGGVRLMARATPADVDAICGALPETELGTSWGDRPTWKVPTGRKGRGFVLHRAPQKNVVDPATGEPYPDLLVISVPDEAAKLALVESDGPFFTIPHFDGYNAVLVQQSRFGEISRAELAEVLTEAWAAVAPARLVREHLGD